MNKLLRIGPPVAAVVRNYPEPAPCAGGRRVHRWALHYGGGHQPCIACSWWRVVTTKGALYWNEADPESKDAAQEWRRWAARRWAGDVCR